MNAFVKTTSGSFKVYRHGQEWQILGPSFERWFSVWSADVRGSLDRALSSIPGEVIDFRIVSLDQV